MKKVITTVVHDELERFVASLSIKEKKKFIILTPTKVVALIPSKILVRPKFVIETTAAQGMTQSRRCYTLKELSLGAQKKDQGKRTINKDEA